MTMASDAEIHTLATPYALHALPADEVELFERHLAECSACRSEVDEIRETSSRLGLAMTTTPPPELKSQVMARIAGVRPLPPVPEVESDTAEPGRGTGPVAGSADGAGAGPAQARAWQRWWPRIATGVAAAMTAAVVALAAQLADVRDDLERSQAIGAQMRELVEAPDVAMVRASDDGSNGTVLMARSIDTAVLIADGMNPAPDAHTYQLWFIEDGDMRSAGILGSDDDGRLGPFTAHGLDDAGQLGITVEPAGGSEQPTTDPVMVIDLPA
ncbi:MAG TPA: anti-sigma factor [Jiangellaceae bacterium]